MAQICRTCAQNIITKDFYYLNGVGFVSSTLRIKDLLKSCIPDIEVDSFPDSIMCRNCTSALHFAYIFKTEVIKNDKVFHDQWNLGVVNIRDHEVSLNDAQLEAVYRKLDVIEIVKEEFSETSVTIDSSTALKTDEHIQTVQDCVAAEDEIAEIEQIYTEAEEDDMENEQIYTATEEDIMENEQTSFVAEKDVTQITGKADTASEHLQKRKIIESLIQNEAPRNRNVRDINRPHKCGLCSYRADSKATLLTHTRTHTGERPFHCTYCYYKARRKDHLQHHLRLHTGERPFKCATCSKTFLSKQLLLSHAAIHSEQKPYSCKQCSFRTKFKSCIVNHVKRIHLGLSEPSEAKRRLCTICGKSLSAGSSFRSHMRIHSGEKSHLCQVCGKYFREKTALKMHMRVHSGEKPFKCEKCDYVSTRKAHVQEHMRIYREHAELFTCIECGKQYAGTAFLKKHMKEEHKEYNHSSAR